MADHPRSRLIVTRYAHHIYSRRRRPPARSRQRETLTLRYRPDLTTPSPCTPQTTAVVRETADKHFLRPTTFAEQQRSKESILPGASASLDAFHVCTADAYIAAAAAAAYSRVPDAGRETGFDRLSNANETANRILFRQTNAATDLLSLLIRFWSKFHSVDTAFE
jgi:hypothetical protein